MSSVAYTEFWDLFSDKKGKIASIRKDKLAPNLKVLINSEGLGQKSLFYNLNLGLS